eukprot:3444165-Pleurochrysis_carterae.AAC.1
MVTGIWGAGVRRYVKGHSLLQVGGGDRSVACPGKEERKEGVKGTCKGNQRARPVDAEVVASDSEEGLSGCSASCYLKQSVAAASANQLAGTDRKMERLCVG